jgi:hypothetical protein
VELLHQPLWLAMVPVVVVVPAFGFWLSKTQVFLPTHLAIMTLDKAFRPAISLILIALLFVCQIAVRLGSDLNHDTAWFLYVAQGMLNGGELYRDFVEVNPPLAVWLTVPMLMLSRATGLAPVETLYGVFFAVTALSLLLVRRYLAMIRVVPDWSKELALILLAAAFLFIPASSFGQREHLLALLFLPWIVLRFARSRRANFCN